MKVVKRFTFCAAHVLPLHPGRCANIHGHGYVLEVVVNGDIGENGMIEDFGDIKKIVNPVLDTYDHALLLGPDTPIPLLEVVSDLGYKVVHMNEQPTCEVILRDIDSMLPGSYRANRLYETESCWAEL